jgi:ribosomal protein L12E/L44/L45/RPP1/RPP2
MTTAELAVVYASLILRADDVPITGDKVRKLLEAAKVKVDEYYVDSFLQYFKYRDLVNFLRGTAFEPEGLPGEFDDLFG